MIHFESCSFWIIIIIREIESERCRVRRTLLAVKNSFLIHDLIALYKPVKKYWSEFPLGRKLD